MAAKEDRVSEAARPSAPTRTPVRPDNRKLLDAVVAAVRKEFGPDSIRILGEYEPVASLPTGLASLDRAIGVGGIPHARLMEISGAESTGKTTLAKFIIGVFQRAGYPTYYLPTEGGGISDWDEKLGVDPTQFLVSEDGEEGGPPTMEHVFNLMLTVIETLKAKMSEPANGLIVWDSVAATPLKAEAERDFDETGRMAERAGFLARAVPKLVAALAGTKISVLFVNQVRDNPGALPFQEKTYSPGGRALRHMYHLKLQTSRLGNIATGSGENREVTGIKIKVKVTKNKLAPPFREARLKLDFASGRLEDDPETT